MFEQRSSTAVIEETLPRPADSQRDEAPARRSALLAAGLETLRREISEDSRTFNESNVQIGGQ